MATERRLGTHTTVTLKSGETTTLEPGTSESELPEGVEINNESAWATPLDPVEVVTSPNEVGVQLTGDLKDHTVQELLDMARARGIEMPKSASKRELIEALEGGSSASDGS
jgi:Rho termination factor, N-terminal domain.